MSADIFILIVLAACVAYWYSRRAKANKPSTTSQSVPEAVAPSVPQSQSNVDPFMQQLTSEKARTDASISVALQQHERELEERFADDVRLKERLSQFALDNELDKALVALWEEIKHYPAWSSRDDFDEWNNLLLSGISGSKEKDTESIEFMQGTQHFKVTQRTWSGMEGEPYADFSFFEDGDEVFAISCSVDYEDYGTSYSCFNVSAFKNRGNWAKVLLQYYGQIQIAQNKSSAEFKYFRADEIKSRFKE